MLGVQTFFKSYQSTARICVDFAEAGINTNGQVIFQVILDVGFYRI